MALPFSFFHNESLFSMFFKYMLSYIFIYHNIYTLHYKQKSDFVTVAKTIAVPAAAMHIPARRIAPAP